MTWRVTAKKLRQAGGYTEHLGSIPEYEQGGEQEYTMANAVAVRFVLLECEFCTSSV